MKIKKKPFIKQLTVPLYDATLLVTNAASKLEKVTIDGEVIPRAGADGEAGLIELNEGGLLIYIYIGVDRDCDVFDVVPHECFHMASMLAKELGLERGGSDEAVAYIVGYLTKQVFNMLGVSMAKLDKEDQPG